MRSVASCSWFAQSIHFKAISIRHVTAERSKSHLFREGKTSSCNVVTSLRRNLQYCGRSNSRHFAKLHFEFPIVYFIILGNRQWLFFESAHALHLLDMFMLGAFKYVDEFQRLCRQATAQEGASWKMHGQLHLHSSETCHTYLAGVSAVENANSLSS